MLDMENPGRGGARAGASGNFVVAGDNSEDSPSITYRQASILHRRFALSPSVARTVAALAYGEAA